MKDIPPQKLEDVKNLEEIWPDTNARKFMGGIWEDYLKPRTQAVNESPKRGVYGR